MGRAVAVRRPYEWQEQQALFEWARLHEQAEPRLSLLYHSPNGELRTKATAAKLQQMGVKSGVPDVHLPISVQVLVVGAAGFVVPQIYHGCWIELKRLRGVAQATPAQAWWITRLIEEGHYAAVCHGWVEAARKLCWYLHRPDLGDMLDLR